MVYFFLLLQLLRHVQQLLSQLLLLLAEKPLSFPTELELPLAFKGEVAVFVYQREVAVPEGLQPIGNLLLANLPDLVNINADIDAHRIQFDQFLSHPSHSPHYLCRKKLLLI